MYLAESDATYSSAPVAYRGKRLSLVSRLLGAAVIAGSVLFGTVPNASAAESVDSGPITMRLAWIPGSLYRLPVAVAKDLFAKHGLKVELMRFTSGPAMNAAFKTGDVDLGYSGPPGVLTILSTGARVKIFMADNDVATSDGLIVQPDSNIKSVADLRGKSIALPRGTVVWVSMARALKQNGMTFSDVKFMDMGVVPAVAAFKSKQVDATWMWSPLFFDLIQSGGREVVRDIKYGSAPNYWMVRMDYAAQHPVAMQRFLAVMEEAEAYFKKDAADTASILAQQFNLSQKNAEQILKETAYFTLEEQVAPSGPASLVSGPSGAQALLEGFADDLKSHGVLRETPAIAGALDPSFVETYLKSKKQ